MRTRLVIWGSNAEDQKVLLGISLNADENKIELVAIPARDCTEEFYNKMMSTWRDGGDLELPISTEKRTLELTMSESILPEDFRVERSDMIQRAQMEWHFLVLSTKLYRNFKSELEEVSDKIKRLDNYDKAIWDELKSLWDNIQKHIFDRNILRDHSDSLREKSNALFEELKKLRSSVEKDILAKSTEIFNTFSLKIEEINNRINSGGVLKLIFDDLKKIQEEFKSFPFTREDRNKVFKFLDDSFNAIREKRNVSGGPQKNEQHRSSEGAMDRISARLAGLNQAVQKIQKSIEFDQKDIDFENKRIASSSSQLEAQIRVAKIKMIEDRMKSKKEKLEELTAIRATLDKTTDSLKRKEEKRIKKVDEKEHRKEEEQKVKAKFEEEINLKQVVKAEDEEKLIKAAEEIKAGNKERKRIPKNIQPNPPVENTELTIDETQGVNDALDEHLDISNGEQDLSSSAENSDSAVSDNNDNQPESASDSKPTEE
ncbi:MAG: hypothetical protein ABI851_00430 [Saprospiraceae bacterium]